jgi:putative ABC transport system substrate-binding protein
VKRRQFIVGLGSTVAWPLAARAQQGDRVRRIGVLISLASDDPEGQVRLAAFVQGLQEWGWGIGRNVQIDTRWVAGDADRARRYAAELVALAPDVIFASGAAALGPLQQASRTVPIVFAAVLDPVGASYVATLARPGGNATGFTALEYSMGGKWLGLLKEVVPQVRRVAVIRTLSVGGGAQFGAIQGAALSFGVELTPIGIRDTGEIERGVAAFARQANGGLIVTGSAPAQVHRELIVTLAAQHRLPAIYPYRYFATGGGLLSYGPNTIDQYRRAAGYIDRILKGEKPADLPVQAPTKYETVLNMKTAKALGLIIPETLLATADEVIQ